MLINFTGLTIMLTILQAADLTEVWNGHWALSYSANLMTIPYRARGKVSQKAHALWISVQYMVLFLDSQESWVQESTGGKREWHHSSLLLLIHSKSFASCSHALMLCWPRGPISRGRNASTRRHNDFTELKVKSEAWLFGVSQAFEPLDKA